MDENNASNVNIVDIDMPFWSMVSFMVKAAIAAIPAIFILTVLGAVLVRMITGINN